MNKRIVKGADTLGEYPPERGGECYPTSAPIYPRLHKGIF